MRFFLQTLTVAASLSAGSFIYQAMNDHNWAVAIDRSYFQAMAVLTFAFVLKITRTDTQ